MSAAYYDFYAEEGSSFVIKINMLDKYSQQICLFKGAESDTPPVYMDIPAELAAINYAKIFKIVGTMTVRPALVGASSTANQLEFKGDSSNSVFSGTVGQLIFKRKGDDHNLVIYYPNIEINPGTYFYDFEMEYTEGILNGTSVIEKPNGRKNTLRVLQGRFIIIPKVK
jgi:hypothetical protein